MRSAALQYRSVIAADYSPELAFKVRFGAIFLTDAIRTRNEIQKIERAAQADAEL